MSRVVWVTMALFLGACGAGSQEVQPSSTVLQGTALVVTPYVDAQGNLQLAEAAKAGAAVEVHTAMCWSATSVPCGARAPGMLCSVPVPCPAGSQ